MTAESKNEQIARLHRKLAAYQAQCHDSAELLGAERMRSADLRAALRTITNLDAVDDPAAGFAAAVRIAGDALEELRP